MATGNGKIANLPREIREELNARLYDGESGNDLVAWLNGKPEVLAVLNEHFEGRPISEQNMSEWRRHGYQQWLNLQLIFSESNALSESADEIAQTGIDCERLLLILTARYAALIQCWNLTPTDQLNYKMGVFRQLTDAVLALRRAELQSIRLQIARERLELLREKQRDKSASSASSPASSSTDSASSPPAPSSSGEHGHAVPPSADASLSSQPENGEPLTPMVAVASEPSPMPEDRQSTKPAIAQRQSSDPSSSNFSHAQPLVVAAREDPPAAPALDSASRPQEPEPSTAAPVTLDRPPLPPIPSSRNPRSRYGLL
jgi:hypothetical protein